MLVNGIGVALQFSYVAVFSQYVESKVRVCVCVLCVLAMQ